MLTMFGIPQEPAVQKRIIARRNNLFHEAKWGAFFPLDHQDTEAAQDGVYLGFLLNALLAASVGYESRFVTGGWYTFSRSDFRPSRSLLQRHRTRALAWKAQVP